VGVGAAEVASTNVVDVVRVSRNDVVELGPAAGAGTCRVLEPRTVLGKRMSVAVGRQPTKAFPWLEFEARAAEDLNDRTDQVVFPCPGHVDNEEVMSCWWAKLRDAWTAVGRRFPTNLLKRR
jgi:hypothetical protein